MVLISNEVKVLAGIEQGSVYNFSPQDGIVNHYYVVLNKNPKNDDEINLAPFTTKKDNVLRFIKIKNLDEKTYVSVEKGECKFLPPRDNIGIDCNRLLYISKEKLIELINYSDGSCNYPKLNTKLFDKIKEGVMVSILVKPSAQDSL